MKLIDADALLKKFCVNSEGIRIPEVDCDNHEITVSIKDIKRIIREQPTVFDSEKYVKQLEEEEEYSYADFEEYAESYGLDLSEYDDWYFQGLKRAITLVKRGVVS